MRLLHPALWLLLRLRYRARIRLMLRDLQTLRGLVAYSVGWSVAAYLLYVASLGDGVAITGIRSESLLQAYQSGLLGLLVVGQIKAIGEKAIYFSPSEVDLLFQAPFERHELLAYRIVSSLGGILITAFVFSLALVAAGGAWLLPFLGTFLGLLMVHLLSTCLAILRETLEEQAFSASRRVALVIVIAVIAASIVYGLHAEAGQGFVAVLSAANATWGMQLILLPFRPFAQVATASGLNAETMAWLAACLLIITGLFAVLMRLDANYLETASQVSRRLDSRLRRARTGRFTVQSTAARLGLPLLPSLRGAGAVAWWQLTSALRSLVALLELAVLVLVISIGTYLTRTAGASEAGEDMLLLTYVGFWSTVFISHFLRFDFRSGVEYIPRLKVLPCPTWAISAGQLFTPVFVTTLLQLVVAALPLRGGDLRPLILTAIFAPLVNTIWYAAENITFLLYPFGAGSRGPGDFQFIGRQIVLLLVKLALLAVNLIVATIAALALSVHVTDIVLVLVPMVWCVLATNAILMVWVLSLVFRRFDPSRTGATE